MDWRIGRRKSAKRASRSSIYLRLYLAALIKALLQPVAIVAGIAGLVWKP